MGAKTSWRVAAVATGLLAGWGSAQAEVFHEFGPATLAQGGTGVALAQSGGGSLMNPAALAQMADSADSNLGVSPTVRAFDQDDLIDSVDDFQDAEYVDQVDSQIVPTENALEDFNDDPGGDADGDGTDNRAELVAALESLETETTDLNAGIQSVVGKPAELEFASALAGSVPSSTFSVGVSARAYGTVGATSTFADDFLTDFADVLDECRQQFDSGKDRCDDPRVLNYLSDSDGDGDNKPDTVDVDPNEDLDSRVLARGIAVREIGLTFARELGLGLPVAVGITPKLQEVTTFDYVAVIDDAELDDFDVDQYTREDSSFNFDMGARWAFGPVSAGMSIRNVIAQQYATAQGEPITVEPQARAGLAYDAGWLRLASDFDVTRNASSGFGDDSRFASLGATIDILGWVQLRGGYRVNTVTGGRDTVSAGVGLAPFRALRFEVGVARSGNDEIGGSAGLRFTF
jgi:hypothetical protein